MTITSNYLPSITPALRVGTFRLHALDIDPALAQCVDLAPMGAVGSDTTTVQTEHWISQSSDSKGAMDALVCSVRKIQRLANETDRRTDAELKADLLKEMGLWECAQPTKVWGHAKCMAKFLWAFTRIYFQANRYEATLLRKNRYAATH